MLNTLSPDEVRAIHEVLAADFAAAADPISPPGVKSQHLLESAVSRQFTGYEGKLKYSTSVTNAAALTYGVCCNHPFHNGNKRTSLVAMLCHLDKNDLMFSEKVSHDELYDWSGLPRFWVICKCSGGRGVHGWGARFCLETRMWACCLACGGVWFPTPSATPDKARKPRYPKGSGVFLCACVAGE